MRGAHLQNGPTFSFQLHDVADTRTELDRV